MSEKHQDSLADLHAKMDARLKEQIQRNLRLAGVVAVFVLCLGSVFYHVVEKLAWIDAFYFSTITLSTVGYGDITPQTDLGKIFTIFYVMVGIGIIGTFASLLLKNAVIRREGKRQK